MGLTLQGIEAMYSCFIFKQLTALKSKCNDGVLSIKPDQVTASAQLMNQINKSFQHVNYQQSKVKYVFASGLIFNAIYFQEFD